MLLPSRVSLLRTCACLLVYLFVGGSLADNFSFGDDTAAGGIPLSNPATEPNMSRYGQLIEDLSSKDREAQERAAARILEDRAALIRDLSAIVNDKQKQAENYFAVTSAMKLLGKLRATESVATLVENIGYPKALAPGVYPPAQEEFLSGGRLGFNPERHPAIAALVEIGEPSTDRVIEKMLTTSNNIERQACITVLQRLMTQSSVAAKVKESLETADPELRAKLEKALSEPPSRRGSSGSRSR